MKILISAAEASSDAHGAELLKALRECAPPGQTVDAFGVGGPHLEAAGLRRTVDARELLAAGLFAVIVRLPKILKGLSTLGRALEQERPDLAVVMDYPDFHFRFARKLRQAGVPAIYYIPPKVWVWRQGRVRFLSRYFRKLLCILPFEERFYQRRGVRAIFVGNPIIDELPLSMTRPEARARLGLKADDRVIVLMPGSRPAELSEHFSVMLDAAARAAGKIGQRHLVLVPLAATARIEEGERRLNRWKKSQPAGGLLEIRLSRGDAHDCLVAADAGLIKSGTSTLEAALLGCPHAILYRGSALVNWIFRKIGYEGPVGLANLASLVEPPSRVDRNQLPFREFLMGDVRADLLGDDLFSLLTDSSRRAAVAAHCAALRSTLVGEAGSGPSRRAAREIWTTFGELKQERAVLHSPDTHLTFERFFTGTASFLWSTANAIMRFCARRGWVRPVKLGSRVISVGNLQAGGSGKTPLVAQIAREAIADGKRTVILTRGYRGAWERSGGVVAPDTSGITAEECGDEVALLHEMVPGAWIGVGENRVAQYSEVEKRLGSAPDLVILDDGFQHWKIHKDLEVVAVTSSGFSERLFRDTGRALRHADLVVWTKGERWPFPSQPADTRVRYRLNSTPQSGIPYFLVSGVGDPASVSRSAKEAGYRVLKHVTFPDHARYAAPVVREVLEDAQQVGAKVVTTGKDWVKWRDFLSPEEWKKVDVIEPEVVFEDGREVWCKRLWGRLL